ncbi:MAG: hypothetical protein LBM77_03600 [Spirochaetaceae bacterium]|jgi:hypothetical protein|nr:hypothetical protein [Spirochaetaceae bacterium]
MKRFFLSIVSMAVVCSLSSCFTLFSSSSGLPAYQSTSSRVNQILPRSERASTGDIASLILGTWEDDSTEFDKGDFLYSTPSTLMFDGVNSDGTCFTAFYNGAVTDYQYTLKSNRLALSENGELQNTYTVYLSTDGSRLVISGSNKRAYSIDTYQVVLTYKRTSNAHDVDSFLAMQQQISKDYLAEQAIREAEAAEQQKIRDAENSQYAFLDMNYFLGLVNQRLRQIYKSVIGTSPRLYMAGDYVSLLIDGESASLYGNKYRILPGTHTISIGFKPQYSKSYGYGIDYEWDEIRCSKEFIFEKGNEYTCYLVMSDEEIMLLHSVGSISATIDLIRE